MAEIGKSNPNHSGVSGKGAPNGAKPRTPGKNGAAQSGSAQGAPPRTRPGTNALANQAGGGGAKSAAAAGASAAKGLTTTQVFLIALAGTLLVVGGIWTFILTREEDLASKHADLLLKSFEQSALSPIGHIAQGDLSDLPDMSFLEPYIAPDEPQYETDQDIERALKALSNYRAIAKIYIKKLDLTLPILSETSTQALKISVCRFQGPEPLEPGNLVITGHNYKNGAHFGRLDTLTEGDEVVITSQDGKSRRYFVYDMTIVEPDDLASLNPGRNQNVVTLVTCATNGTQRLIVKCRSL